jgi:Holliday junction DNA helicase RuvA
MIASIRGRVLHQESNSLVIELGGGGVGFQVFVPASLREEARPGDEIFLHTVLIVRQDALSLYGFENREGREYFNLLLGVDGVGPRLALAVLSTLSTDAIRRAVFHEQAEVFSRVPGVGKKTAQKILLHLQDRLPAAEGLEVTSRMTDTDTELVDALTSLGYSIVEAQAAIQTIPRDTPADIETRLMIALRYFGS